MWEWALRVQIWPFPASAPTAPVLCLCVTVPVLAAMPTCCLYSAVTGPSLLEPKSEETLPSVSCHGFGVGIAATGKELMEAVTSEWEVTRTFRLALT